MARPREFEERAVLAAAVRCFWARGYEATSVRDLVEETGLTAASLYNAFGDKRSLYRKALEYYVDDSVAARIGRCRELPPRDAIVGFFDDILARSLGDPERKGCMLVNAALELAPHDAEFQLAIKHVLLEIEAFFLHCVERGQADGTITTAEPADDLARHLLGVLMGIRVLARVRPEPALLKGIIRPALALLDP
jgi:TetR/AcrR family transcriptional repressor of nem operon